MISGFLADPGGPGDDGGFEYIQLRATRSIDFSITPISIVACNNRSAENGWVAGGNTTFAFNISEGTVAAGTVFYVGGAEKKINGPFSASIANARWLRSIQAVDGTMTGDLYGRTASFLGQSSSGSPHSNAHADGISVFSGDISSLTPRSTPLDAIFYGDAIGNAKPTDRSKGYTLPVNDVYKGGIFGLDGDHIFPNPGKGEFTQFSGVYDVATGQWDSKRSAAQVSLNDKTLADIESQITFASDTSRPTVSLASSRNSLKLGQTAELFLTLSEPSRDLLPLNVLDISLSTNAGTFSPLSAVAGQADTYRTTFTPATGFAGQAIISIAANRFEDVAGNGNAASASLTLSIDTLRPSVSITAPAALLSSVHAMTLSFTTSEPIADLTASDVIVTGGSLSAWTGSGVDYSAVFTPDPDFQGEATVAISAQSFTDAAGNTNDVAFALAPALQVRRNAPFVKSITTSRSTLTIANRTSVIRIEFSRPVVGFTADDVLVTTGAGVLSTTMWDEATNSYTATFTATTGFLGEAVISVPNDVCADADGVLNIGAGLAAPLPIDTLTPEILSIVARRNGSLIDALKANEEALVTFVLNKPVIGFTQGDVVVRGGTLHNFAGAGTSYTATFVPNPNSTTPGSLAIPAAQFVDAQGSINPYSISTSIAINTVVPTLTINQRLPLLKGGQSTLVTFQVRGTVNTAGPNASPFELSDIGLAAGQGSVSALRSVSVARGVHTYTAVYTAPSSSFSGPVTLTVPANSFKVVGNDANGNAAASLTINVDAQGPATVLSTTAQALKIGQTAAIDFTIANETATVVGFEANDITLSSGSISAPVRVPGTNIYRATYTPAPNFEGQVTIGLPASRFTDAAGNPNTAATAITLSVDTKAPAAPAVSLVSDNGVLPTDKITSDARLQTTGTEAGASVQYWTSDALTTAWTPALARQGENTVYVTQTDTAGNRSTTATAFAFEYRTVGPAPTAITLPAASTGLTAGRFVELRVTFARPVFVTGENTTRPFIQIGGFTTGDTTRRAVYASGSGTSTLVFRYQVQTGDKALAGITYPASSISLDGATIRDAADNTASLAFTLPSRRPVTRINA